MNRFERLSLSLVEGSTDMLSLGLGLNNVSVTGVRGQFARVLGTLFSNNEPGFLTTISPEFCFADPAGTNPAIVGGTVAYVADRSGNGNHWTQPTLASRPILGRKPVGGRRNLLVRTEEFEDVAWGKLTQGTGVAPVLTSGFADPEGNNTAWRLELNAGSNGSSDYSLIRQSSGLWPDTGTRSIWLRSNTGSNQTVSLVATSSSLRVTVTPNWQRFDQLLSAGAKQLDVSVGGTALTGATADVLIWHPQVEASATATPYQRVVTQFDVTEAGKPNRHYLFGGGAADPRWMITPTITPGTDKVQVFAGVRKLSDAAAGVLTEFGPSILNNGTFVVSAPNSALPNYGFATRGTVGSASGAYSAYFAPDTSVLTCEFDNAGTGTTTSAQLRARRNGAALVPRVSATTAGNYLAYPTYIGARAGTSLFLNGEIYSMITRFGPNLTTTEIERVEAYVASQVAEETI